MIELLPCPFCGAAPNMQPYHGGGPQKRIVECVNDGDADGLNWCAVQPSVCGSTPSRAAEVWNRRAGSPPGGNT